MEAIGGSDDDPEATYQASLGALREHAEEATTVLHDAYQAAPEEAYTERWAFTYTLGELHTHHAHPALREIALAPVPPERWANSHESSTTEEAMIRVAAVEALADLAKRGNRAAEETLLALLGHADVGTRQTAVVAYLDAAPDRAARVATLKSRLASADHWMIAVRPVDIELLSEPAPPPRRRPEADGPRPGVEDQS
jgi:hypothetical protein